MKKSLFLEHFLAIVVLLSITIFSANAQTNITSSSAASISSSFQAGYYTASDLVDGNTDPDDFGVGWYAAPFHSGSEWAAFDFGSGSKAKIVRYDLYGHTSADVRPRKHEFQARNTTTESWVTLKNVSTQIGAGQNIYNVTDSVYYRYYRVLMTQNGGGANGTAGFQEVMLYGELCTHTSSTINESACDSYTSPSGNYTWTTSGTYKDTIPNAGGCDSVITINLTINSSTNSTLNESACDSYTSPSGNYTWTSSGTYQDTIPNAAGCDSLITINLTVGFSTNSTINEMACGTYTSPSSNYTWTSSGTYQDTIPNFMGCDSVITINLTINSATTSNINAYACASYTSPSGNYTWTSPGTYQDIIPNAAGCDSIITVRLYINNTYVIINETRCDSYTSPSGNHTWTSSGTYKDTIPNAVDCDSVITINLTINTFTTATMSKTVCDGYVCPSGNYIWTTSGIYQDTLDNFMGCDSILSINLTVNSVDTSVFKEGSMLRSNESGGTYQWIDCSDSSLISEATDQSYTASVDGDYAVIVTNNGCTDTSACYNVLASSAKSDFGKDFVVYPNPTSESVSVDLGSTHRLLTVSITDLNGRIVFKNNYYNHQSLSFELKEYPVGIYFMKIVSEDKSIIIKLIKE